MDQAAGQPAWLQRVVEKESCFPPDVQRRLRALRKIQLRMVILDGEFYREVYHVLAKCHNLYDEFYQRRADIISGAYEPTERDCVWDDEFPDDMKGDYGLLGDESNTTAELHKDDSGKDECKASEGMNAGNEEVKDEEQGKVKADRTNDEICKTTAEKGEVDESTELAEMETTRTDYEIGKTEERKGAEESDGLAEGGKEESAEVTRNTDEVPKIAEANELTGLAEGGKEEMAEETRANDEVPKIAEGNEPTGLAEGGKEETAEDTRTTDEVPKIAEGNGPAGLAEGGEEEMAEVTRTNDELPKIAEGNAPTELTECGKEETAEVTRNDDDVPKIAEGNEPAKLAEGGREEMAEVIRTDDESPKIAEGKQPAGLIKGGKEEMAEVARTDDEVPKISEGNAPAGLAEGERKEMAEVTRTDVEVPKIAEGKQPAGLAEGGKEEMSEVTRTGDEVPKIAEGKKPAGLAEGGKEEMAEVTRTNDEVPKIAEGKEPAGLAEGGKEETEETTGSPNSETEMLDNDEKGAKAEIKDGRSSEKLRGIPDFWLTIFMNVEMLRELVEERDKPVLSHLIDIRTVYHEEDKPMGFTLEFHFSPNNYFTNTVLTKDYDLILRWHNHDPFTFHGPKMTGCRGCTINWKDGKNVTIMEIIKKQTHKRRGTKRTVTRVLKVKSFFDFFSPPSIPEDPNDLDDDSLQILRKDCQVAHYLWDGVNPSPLLFYTGEIWDRDDLDAYYFTELEGGGDDEV